MNLDISKEWNQEWGQQEWPQKWEQEWSEEWKPQTRSKERKHQTRAKERSIEEWSHQERGTCPAFNTSHWSIAPVFYKRNGNAGYEKTFIIINFSQVTI